MHVQQLLTAAHIGADNQLAALKDFLHFWKHEIQPHCDIEESCLAPFMQSQDIAEMKKQHEHLDALARQAQNNLQANHVDGELLSAIAKAIKDHLRWEERHLYPTIESQNAPERLRALQEKTKAYQDVLLPNNEPSDS